MFDLEQIVSELESARSRRSARTFDPEHILRHLTPPQRRTLECAAPAINVLGGRQGGKTFTDVAFLLLGGLTKPNTLNPYFALTAESVGRIMWPEALRWADLLSLPSSCLNEHTHTIRLPNGSMVVGTGTDDKRKIETWRGVKANHIAVDEMGAQPDSFIRYFVAMLWPTMIKNRGRMIRSGNPGLVLTGYWYDQTNDDRMVDVPLFHWTAWDNPFLGTPAEVDEFVDTALRDEGITRESATFAREWMARWVEDVGALVFPIQAHNNAQALPGRSRSGAILDPGRWRYVVGVDVGVVDETAIAVVASHPDDPREWVVSTEKHSRMLTGQLAARLRDILTLYPRAPVVLDTGGMGKLHAEELQRRFALPILPAEKREKESAIRTARDLLLAGRIMILIGPANDALRDEWAVLGWDDDKRLPNPSQADHASDATLYALRKLRHYRETEAAPPPTLAQQFEMEEREMRRIREREVRASKQIGRKAEWDR